MPDTCDVSTIDEMRALKSFCAVTESLADWPLAKNAEFRLLGGGRKINPERLGESRGGLDDRLHEFERDAPLGQCGLGFKHL